MWESRVSLNTHGLELLIPYTAVWGWFRCYRQWRTLTTCARSAPEVVWRFCCRKDLNTSPHCRVGDFSGRRGDLELRVKLRIKIIRWRPEAGPQDAQLPFGLLLRLLLCMLRELC